MVLVLAFVRKPCPDWFLHSRPCTVGSLLLLRRKFSGPLLGLPVISGNLFRI
jgi:hypothetical protein